MLLEILKKEFDSLNEHALDIGSMLEQFINDIDNEEIDYNPDAYIFLNDIYDYIEIAINNIDKAKKLWR